MSSEIAFSWVASHALLKLHFYPIIDKETATHKVKQTPPVVIIGRTASTLAFDKIAGTIAIDDNTTLTGVPPQAWDYTLGNRSAIEWILDQYKEKKPTDPTIAEQFNTYRFADYKETVIDLIQRVCTVSVKTMQIVHAMPV